MHLRPGLLAVVFFWLTATAFATSQGSALAAGRLVVAPDCPNFGTKPIAGQFTAGPLTVTYAPASLRKRGNRQSGLLTLHVAPVKDFASRALDYPMARQNNGAWTATFTIPQAAIWPGYFLLDVEDDAHRVDNNGGQYWDISLCRDGTRLATEVAEARTYDGHVVASGFQRAPDLQRALKIVRDGHVRHPDSSIYLFWMWEYERRIGNESSATFAQISRELSEELDKPHASAMLQQIVGWVSAYESKLDLAAVAKLRAAILALPDSQPLLYGQDGRLHPVERTPQWEDGTIREKEELLADLDFPLLAEVKPASAQASAYELYANEKRDCANCRSVSDAFYRAVMAFAKSGELDAAKRVETEWAAWDPRNPDPPATLANVYLQANRLLPDALVLVNRSAELYAPFADRDAWQAEFKNIKSQFTFTVPPDPEYASAAPLLRGKIEAALGDWTSAAKDLQAACDTMLPAGPGDYGAAHVSLGSALTHTGNMDGALAAYLKAAAAPIQTSPEASDDYKRLFVEAHRGSFLAAEANILAAVSRNEKADAADYVPVELHRAMPSMQLTTMAGKSLPVPARNAVPMVVDFWSVWCGACVAELPGLLAFQRAHPGTPVLAVAVSDQPDEVARLLKQRHLEKLHVAILSALPEQFGNGVPVTAVTGRNGELAFFHEGAPADLPALLEKDLAILR